MLIDTHTRRVARRNRPAAVPNSTSIVKSLNWTVFILYGIIHQTVSTDATVNIQSAGFLDL